MRDSLVLKKIHPTDKRVLDSVLKIYHGAKVEKDKIIQLVFLSENLNGEKLWPAYNSLAYAALQKMKLTSGLAAEENIFLKTKEAACLNNFGIVENQYGNRKKALEFFSASVKLKEELNDKKALADALTNLAGLLNDMGQQQQALDMYARCLKLTAETGDKKF